MKTNFQDVADFHHKFEIAYQGDPRLLPPELHRFRMQFMQEELVEYHTAVEEKDLTKAFDALLDLAYVVFGTAHLMGLPWQDGWDAVQEANMSKVRGRTHRGNDEFDVCKPEGWVGPEVKLTRLLQNSFLNSREDVPNGKASNDQAA